MPAKEILYGKPAREKVLAGVNKLANAIRPTMGPKGRTAIIEQGLAQPIVTMDGVSVAREIEHKDPHENMGARLLIQAASKSNDEAGDGTSTAIIVAAAIMGAAMKYIKKGANPILMKRGLEKAANLVEGFLKTRSIAVEESEQIRSIAKISSRDDMIADSVADAIEKSGEAGLVTIEQSNTTGIEVDHTDGMQFGGGWVSPYMVTDPKRMRAVYENALVLVYDRDLSAHHEIMPILEMINEKGRKQLVIICENAMNEALAAFVVNKLKGIFYTLAVKAPAFGDRRKEMLQDIAAITGATLISHETGRKLDSVKFEDLGNARRIEAYKDHTVVIEGGGEDKEMEARKAEIEQQIEEADDDYDISFLKERLANFDGGVAVIKVGGTTETEQKERQHRVDDALCAARAAREEGILAGGGVAYLRAAEMLRKKKFKNKYEDAGRQILIEALRASVSAIAENAGLNPKSVIKEILSNSWETYGYNALDEKFEDLIPANVIDPTKVERVALENAVSVAGMFLTLETSIVEILPEGMPAFNVMSPGGGIPQGYSPVE